MSRFDFLSVVHAQRTERHWYELFLIPYNVAMVDAYFIVVIQDNYLYDIYITILPMGRKKNGISAVDKSVKT